MKDQVFSESRKILECKARLLQEQGMSKNKNASKAIDSGKEELPKARQYFFHLFRQNSVVSMHSTFWSTRISGTHN